MDVVDEARLANLLGALAVGLSDRLDQVVDDASGLRLADAAALNAAGQFPGSTIETIRRSLGITHGGVVRIVDRLSVARLMERRAGPDGRSVAVYLTASGRELWRRQTRARRHWIEGLLAQVPEASQAHVEPVVAAMLAALTDDDATAEIICRLCEESVCPQDRCPVTCAVAGAS